MPVVFALLAVADPGHEPVFIEALRGAAHEADAAVRARR
jgi:hypothetical protein